jgi:hypothetical protein
MVTKRNGNIGGALCGCKSRKGANIVRAGGGTAEEIEPEPIRAVTTSPKTTNPRLEINCKLLMKSLGCRSTQTGRTLAT